MPQEVRESIAELWLAAAEGAGNDRHTLRQVVFSGLVILSRPLSGELWGRVQFSLGNALRSLGDLDGDAALLREAVTAYRMALRERTRDRTPLEWALTQNNLGIAMVRLGGLAGDRAVLREAIAAFEVSLLEYTRESAPLEWAGAQTNLGITLRSLGDLDGDAALLREAVAAHRMAFEEFTRERAPLEWATTQINLGSVLQSLGDLDHDRVVLLEAVIAYRRALEELTRECAPLGWAMIQYNLGGALESLGVLAGDMAVLREAVIAYRMALEERTHERAPLDWAATRNNLGLTLSHLGNLAGDDAVVGEAISAFRTVLEKITRERHPEQWERTQENLGIALQCLGDLTGDGAFLREAVAVHQAVLEERTRERTPLAWAKTQYNLGNALQRLGVRAGDAARLREATIAFRAALEEFTRERAPVQWAMTQNNLGHALGRLGALDDDGEVTGQAITACQMALEVFDDSSDEDQRQGIARGLARLLIRLGRYDEAVAVIDPTLARSDAAIMDASRSRDGRARSVEQVGELYSVGSLCRLRQDPPDIAAALMTAEAGRARLLTNALALDETRIEDLAAEVRQEVLVARGERDRLRHRLGFAPAAWADGAMTGRSETALRRAPAPGERAVLEAELRRADDHYLALCRQYGLIRAPEPLSYEEILKAAPAGGALVMPAVTETEAFAFIVAGGSGKAELMELGKLDRQMLMQHLNEGWLNTYNDTVAHRGFNRRNPAYQDWNRQIAATQEWLWQVLLEPIDTHLRHKARLEDDAPVVLLPSGLLGLLPLQAAGPGKDGRHFCEHWTVSFAPSVKSLVACRQRLAARREVRAKLLAVIDPPGLTPLAGARAEAAMLRRVFADAEQVILEGEAAKLQPVLQHLPSATYVHPSTHGRHDPLQPQLSQLHLADIPLRLEMLHDTRLDAARLVFLSACESGLAGVRKMPEEFVGLPAGFVQAGAAAVAGSLWPVFDDAAFLLSDKFYELHLNHHGKERLTPAVALRQAQDWLRHVTYRELKTRFPIQRDANGAYLELYQAPRITAGTETIRPLSLPLGPDADCPYAQPHEWAAFTLTGA